MIGPRLSHEDGREQIAWIGGTVHGVALDAAATDGRLTVLRSSMGAHGASPVHRHPDEDETLILLSGSMIVWAGDEKWDLAVGDVAFLPRGVLHSYYVVEDADLLTICTPSGMERFFRSAGWDLARGPVPAGWRVEPSALQQAAAAGGQEILGPPPAPDEELIVPRTAKQEPGSA